MSIVANLEEVKNQIPDHVTLVAVSKTKSSEEIMEAYQCGQLDFGENKVQELVAKSEDLPKDIRWHQIGHLQSNKVKYIAPFVHLIHAVDSKKLLNEINKRAIENKRQIAVLLQFHIAQESSKFGFSKGEVENLYREGFFEEMDHIEIRGVMGMATFTPNQEQIRKEFQLLKNHFSRLKEIFGNTFNCVSMGMSGDYLLAIEEGSTMVRVGSKIFGQRNY